jgi:hypothetical protein
MRIAASLDSDTLAAQQAARLERLVDEADFFTLPRRLAPPVALPDAFEYRVDISSVQRRHAIVVVDGSVPDRLRPLLDYLTTLTFLNRQKSG